MKMLALLVVFATVSCSLSSKPVDSGAYRFAVVHSPRAVAAVCLDNCAWISVQAGCRATPCEIGLNWNGISAGDRTNGDLVIAATEGSGRFMYRCNRSTCRLSARTWSSSVKSAKLKEGETVEVDSGALIDLVVSR